MPRSFVTHRHQISGEGLRQFLETVFFIPKLMVFYWVIVSGGFLCPGTLWSQTLAFEPVLSGLASPLYVTNAHDGSERLFILEQKGRIKVLQPGATTPTLLLDLTAHVLAGGERGLLGLAFHPQFATNRRFLSTIHTSLMARRSSPNTTSPPRIGIWRTRRRPSSSPSRNRLPITMGE